MSRAFILNSVCTVQNASATLLRCCIYILGCTKCRPMKIVDRNCIQILICIPDHDIHRHVMKRKDMKLWMNRFPLLTSSQKCDTTNYRNQSSVFAESENAFMNIRGDGPRAKTSILALTAMNQFSDDFMYLQYTYGRSVFQSRKHLLLCTPQTLNVQQQTVKITSYGMCKIQTSSHSLWLIQWSMSWEHVPVPNWNVRLLGRVAEVAEEGQQLMNQ